MGKRRVLELTDLETVVVKIDTLRPHPDNPRNGDTDLIVQSLKAHGQYRPILVSSDNVVIAGNHTYAALMELGREKVAVTKLPINSEDPQAIEIMLMDNRSSDVAKYDDGRLAELLNQIRADQDGILATGFNDDFHKNLLEKINQEAPIGFPEVGDGLATDYACPSCGYSWSGKPK